MSAIFLPQLLYVSLKIFSNCDTRAVVTKALLTIRFGFRIFQEIGKLIFPSTEERLIER